MIFLPDPQYATFAFKLRDNIEISDMNNNGGWDWVVKRFQIGRAYHATRRADPPPDQQKMAVVPLEKRGKKRWRSSPLKKGDKCFAIPEVKG
jgi:hypothetical protein